MTEQLDAEEVADLFDKWYNLAPADIKVIKGWKGKSTNQRMKSLIEEYYKDGLTVKRKGVDGTTKRVVTVASLTKKMNSVTAKYAAEVKARHNESGSANILETYHGMSSEMFNVLDQYLKKAKHVSVKKSDVASISGGLEEDSDDGDDVVASCDGEETATSQKQRQKRKLKSKSHGCVQSLCEVRTDIELLFWVGAGRSVFPWEWRTSRHP